jgi:DNA polymerase IIIc chi subunit
MPQIDFYHLTQSDIETALVMLVQKSLLAGKKVLVQCPRPAAEIIGPGQGPCLDLLSQ